MQRTPDEYNLAPSDVTDATIPLEMDGVSAYDGLSATGSRR
ncbi:hypothetical protein ACFQO4_01135 [Saliphagus sp. GCM10025334]